MKKNNVGLIVLFLITAAAVLAAVWIFIFWMKEPGSMKSSSIDDRSSHSLSLSKMSVSEEEPIERQDAPEPEESGLPEGSLSDWNLILLNPEEDHKIDQDLSIEMSSFDGQSVDERAAQAYEEMRGAAQEAGITLFLRSGFRSMATQEQNYQAAIKRNRDSGMTEEEALAATRQYYTMPGHSEHHTGLAFDIITPEYHRDVYTLDDRFAETDAYPWLLEHCADYGFILRYPREKEDITQISFEPWHYRYVGVEHARYIMEHGLCLEEYIELLLQDGR